MKFLAFLLLLAPASSFAATLQAGTVTLADVNAGVAGPLQVIHIDGNIAGSVQKDFEKAFQNYKAGTSTLINLNSPGGASDQGYAIVKMIQDARASGRNVQTVVENGAMCASMCVAIYMQGKRRYAGEAALFMFHGAVSDPDYSNVPSFYGTETYIKALLDAGISPAFIDSLRQEGVFTKPGAYWIDGRELTDAGSNVITKIQSRHDTPEPWTADVEPQIRSR